MPTIQHAVIDDPVKPGGNPGVLERLDQLPAPPPLLREAIEACMRLTSGAWPPRADIDPRDTLATAVTGLWNSGLWNTGRWHDGPNGLGPNELGPNASGPTESGTVAAARARAELWRHAMMTGSIAARLVPAELAATAFAAGLLHDIGKAALLQVMPKSYLRVIGEADRLRRSFCDVERALLGTDHTQAGAWVMESWGFPTVLIETARLHHQPSDGMPGIAEPGRSLARVVRAADHLAGATGIGIGGYDLTPLASSIAEIDLSRAGVDQAVELARQDLEGLSSRLAEIADKANANDEGRLARDWARATAAFADCAVSCRGTAALCRSAASALAEALAVDDLAVCAWVGGSATGATATRGHRGASASIPRTRDEVDPAIGRQPLSSLERMLVEQAGVPDVSTWTAHRRRCGDVTMSIVVGAEGAQRLKGGPTLADGFTRTVAMAILFDMARADACRREDELLDLHRRSAVTGEERATRKSVAMIGEMAAGAAHELNNPLAVISGRAQMVRSSPGHGRTDDWLSEIVDQAARATGIVNELITFAKPAKPMPERRPLADILDRVLQRWQTRFTDHAIKVDRRPLAAGLTIHIDETQFGFILEALLDNGAYAMRSTGGVIKVNSPSLPSDEQVRIMVEDNGIGMSAEVLAHAVDPFYSHREAGRGRGLGLSLAYRLTELNGGRLWIDSTPHAGTTVTLEFPAHG